MHVLSDDPDEVNTPLLVLVLVLVLCCAVVGFACIPRLCCLHQRDGHETPDVGDSAEQISKKERKRKLHRSKQLANRLGVDSIPAGTHYHEDGIGWCSNALCDHSDLGLLVAEHDSDGDSGAMYRSSSSVGHDSDDADNTSLRSLTSSIDTLRSGLTHGVSELWARHRPRGGSVLGLGHGGGRGGGMDNGMAMEMEDMELRDEEEEFV